MSGPPASRSTAAGGRDDEEHEDRIDGPRADDSAIHNAHGKGEDDDEDDEDWSPSDGDEEEDEEDDGDSAVLDDSEGGGGAAAARIFSSILRQIGGAQVGSQVTARNIQQILAGLAEQGLLHQDEDGNLVMMAGDDEDVIIDEADEDENDDDEAASGDEGDEDTPPVLQRDDAAVAEYASYTCLDRTAGYPTNVLRSLESFQQSHHMRPTSASQLAALSARHIPSVCTSTESFEGRAFCGKFSHGGAAEGDTRSMFAAASQDGVVHLYETDTWRMSKEIEAREIGWSIVDIDFSTDSRFVIYSSWSTSVQLINTQGGFELHESLEFEASRRMQHSCFFGIRFSPNESREILAGVNGGGAMLYDIERKRNVWSAQAHDDDVNSVCWLDNSGNLFATGSDDASIRIWDRRLLSASSEDHDGDSHSSYARGTPVGGFVGHLHGLTCVSPMPDGGGRYLLSNSKDQSMKLWDTRRMVTPAALAASTPERSSQRDYRWQRLSRREIASTPAAARQAAVDTSIVTFTGHSVSQTLIRCDFSPLHSTGCRYAITGSSDGATYVYDILTGTVVNRIGGHQSIVRDVAWHDQIIVSSSWDHSIRRFALHEEQLHDNESARAEARRRRHEAAEAAEEEEEEEEE